MPKLISGADILAMGKAMADLERLPHTRRVTFHTEQIINAYRFEPGTYEITRVDPPAETETPF